MDTLKATVTNMSVVFCCMMLIPSCREARVDPAEKRVVVKSGRWELVGDLVVPGSGGSVPAVLMLNKAAGNRAVYSGLAAELTGRGIASLRLDLRGHGESVNLGMFVPTDEGRAMIAGTEADIVAACAYLRSLHGIDSTAIAVVGASYSGEEMMQAARIAGYADAYVALSPGSLSDESIRSIDSTGIPWFYIASKDERWLKEVTAAVLQMSRSAETLILPGTNHATDILQSRPDIAARIAEWLAANLKGRP